MEFELEFKFCVEAEFADEVVLGIASVVGETELDGVVEKLVEVEVLLVF